jgi:hypothetical protein
MPNYNFQYLLLFKHYHMLGFTSAQQLDKHQNYLKWFGFWIFSGLLCGWYGQLPINSPDITKIIYLLFIILPMTSGISYLLYSNIMFILNLALPRNIAHKHASEMWICNKQSILSSIQRLDFSVISEPDKILLSDTDDIHTASAILVAVWDKAFEQELQNRLRS